VGVKVWRGMVGGAATEVGGDVDCVDSGGSPRETKW